jgi:hypothetical protein
MRSIEFQNDYSIGLMPDAFHHPITTAVSPGIKNSLYSLHEERADAPVFRKSRLSRPLVAS